MYIHPSLCLSLSLYIYIYVCVCVCACVQALRFVVPGGRTRVVFADAPHRRSVRGSRYKRYPPFPPTPGHTVTHAPRYRCAHTVGGAIRLGTSSRVVGQ